MRHEQGIRSGYLARAVVFAIIAVLCFLPARKYLAEYAQYIQGGIHEFFR